MGTMTAALRIWVRAVGTLMILLGLLLWTGNFDRLTGAHMLLGITLVLAVWGLAGIGAVTGLNRGQIALAFAWGLITPILGLTQTRILPDAGHWVIQIVHLLVGLGLIGQGEGLARGITRTLAARTQQAHATERTAR